MGKSATAAALLVLLSVPPAWGQTNLRLELAEVARAVQKQLAGFDETAVALGVITGPPQQAGNAGPGIASALREELVRLGLKVLAGARFQLQGSYRDVTDARTERLVIELTTRLADRNGKRVIELQARGIFGEETAVAMLGLNVALTPGATAKQRDEQLDQEPQTHVHGAVVRAAKDSPYGVEVLVKKDGRSEPRAARLDKGLPYVALARDEVYALRLINDSADEAAVTLTIDGINVLAFSTLKDARGEPLFTTLVLPPRRAGVVPGWIVTPATSQEFLVTSYAKSAAAELQSPAPVGVITATFAAAWPKLGARPADEPAQAPPGSRAGDATGRGSAVEANYATVERRFGVLRAAVSIRYTRPE